MYLNLYLFPYPSIESCVMGAQKNRLIETFFCLPITYEGDPRSNANPSVISFKFAIIKDGLPVYYDILSILLNLITFFNISHGNSCCEATREYKVNDLGHA